MNREDLRMRVRESWRDLLPTMTYEARDRVNGEDSWVCPLCGHGTNGDGLTFNPRSRDRNALKCFGCGFEGDILDLYQKVKPNVGFTDALRTLGEELGETLDNAPSVEREAPAPAESSSAPEEEKDLTPYYRECMARLNDPAAVAYLSRRGISVETARKCWIGYDPKADPAESGKHTTPRIIIPSSKSHYVGRSIDPDTDPRFAKLNNKGGVASIFNSKALHAQDVQEIFVVEGAFDALSLLEIGSMAIALNSVSNAAKLIKMLEKKPVDATLILCLDDDDAGHKATVELQDGLNRLNISHVTADVCAGHKDPNEALVADRAAFVAAVEKAKLLACSRPDNIALYIENQMDAEIERLHKVRKTGFFDLDEQGGGLYSGLYVVAAISSLGKTTFCHQMCDQMAAAGEDVLFFSLEQSRLELVTKSLSRITAQMNKEEAVTSLAIRRGYRPPQVQAALKKYKHDVQDRLSIIEGNFNCTASFIGNYVRQYIRRNGVRPVVFVDYLQVLLPEKDEKGRTPTAREAVDTTVTSLKRLSRELDLTIIVVSSVNRSNYLTPIDFESLKESGGIEYTADVVWGLQLQALNDPVFDKENKVKEKREIVKQAKVEVPRKIELVCLKNRYGVSSYSSFFEYDPAHDLFTQTLDFSDIAARDLKTNPIVI